MSVTFLGGGTAVPNRRKWASDMSSGRDVRAVRARVAGAGLAATALVALAACGNGSADADASGEGGLGEITWVNPAPGVEAWQNVETCLREAADEAGVEVKVVGASGGSQDARATQRLVEQAIASGTDAISVLTAGGEAILTSTLQEAKDQGIYVATMESGSTTELRNFDVGLDIPRFAEDVAAEIAKQDGPKKVGVLSVGLTGTPKLFNDTLEEALADVEGAEIVDVVTDNGDVTKDADLVGDMLTAHPDIDYVVTNAPGMMAGVETALREKGVIGDVSAFALSFDDSTKAALESGAARGVYVQRLCDVGTLTVETFVALAAGEDVPKDVPVEAEFATKDTYESYDVNWG